MTDVMTHRGPDDRGLHLEDGVALGVRRLSIVDVEHGHQPFGDERGAVWAIQNGELYNHVAIREQLVRRGHRLRTRCDTEILPHLYEDHGASFPRLLRGMFGLAVWDARARRAVLARDRLGIKPLYHARVGDVLVFASELKSLLASGLVEPALDYEAIDAYLTLGFVPGPRTPLAGVSKLPPGHVLVADAAGVRSEAYWRYPKPRPLAGLSAEEHRRALLDLLDESVRLRLMSDVPLGAMLSGGLDSSLIVALMARHVSEPLRTFAVGFADVGRDNELEDARRVAAALGSEHHELELSYATSAVELEQLVWHLDEPLADLSALGFLALCELTSRHVTVALSGQGADELFGGYARHRAAALAGAWRRLPAPVRLGAMRLAPLAPARARRALPTIATESTVDRLLAMASGSRIDGLRARLPVGPLAALDGASARRALAARLGDLPDDPLPATLYVDAQLGLVDDMLHYFDRASMAHSLEVRVPFLDHELVELCAGIPPQLKVRRLRTKHILREAARGLVPDWVLAKRKVGFFNDALAGWLATQARGALADALLRPEANVAELLDARALRELVARASAGDAAASHVALGVLVLELWLTSYLPRALRAGRSSEPVPAAAGGR